MIVILGLMFFIIVAMGVAYMSLRYKYSRAVISLSSAHQRNARMGRSLAIILAHAEAITSCKTYARGAVAEIESEARKGLHS